MDSFMDYTALANIAVYTLVFALGLSVGSFLNVVIYRLPRDGLSVSQPRRSFCPNCHAHIQWYDNIPVFSWLWLKARCRACGQPIGSRYPLVELSSGILAVILLYNFGLNLTFLLHFYFVMCLLAIALIDLELMVIPMALVYPTAILGLINALAEPQMGLSGFWLWSKIEPQFGDRLAALTGSLAGLLLGWLSLKAVSVGYKIARGHEGMGDGDPPLLAMIGAFLGWRSVPLVILWSTLIGLASVVLLMITTKKSQKPDEGWGMKALPFGPFLVLGALLYLFFGPSFLSWYWSLMM